MAGEGVLPAAKLDHDLQRLIDSSGVPPLAFALAFVAGAGHAAPGVSQPW
jgi:hypothetical protein